jgi:hypothetical protein
MASIFISYYQALKNYFDKNKRILEGGFVLLLTVISGIYINLFTNSNGLSNFFGINWNIYGELFFMLGFGLVAGISLLKAFLSLVIIGIIGVVSSFVLYLIYRIYKKILETLSIYSNLLWLFILTLVFFIIALIILFIYPYENIMTTPDLLKFLLVFFLVWLGLINSKLFIEEVDKRKKAGKFYRPKKMDEYLKKKTLNLLLIIGFTLLLMWGSWVLADHFAKIHSKEYIPIIIQSAVFLAGFGLLAMNKDSEESRYSVFVPNLKHIIGWSMLSIIFAFLYLTFETSQFAEMLFRLSGAFLFFTLSFVIVLVLFHDNEYLKEAEKPKSSTSH